jgi:hypothetical protein
MYSGVEVEGSLLVAVEEAAEAKTVLRFSFLSARHFVFLLGLLALPCLCLALGLSSSPEENEGVW